MANYRAITKDATNPEFDVEIADSDILHAGNIEPVTGNLILGGSPGTPDVQIKAGHDLDVLGGNVLLPTTTASVGQLQIVGDPQQAIRSVAVACGAAGEFLEAARRAGCDALVLGETGLHTCLEAEAIGIGLVLPGHYASERFAVEDLADILASQFPDLEVWASREERDPLQWV